MATRFHSDWLSNKENIIPIQLTRAERVNAISSAIIAFVTLVGLMVGLYYNLQSTGAKIIDIFIFESIFITMVISIIIWLIFHMKEGD